jgi:hypothetical protein
VGGARPSGGQSKDSLEAVAREASAYAGPQTLISDANSHPCIDRLAEATPSTSLERRAIVFPSIYGFYRHAAPSRLRIRFSVPPVQVFSSDTL